MHSKKLEKTSSFWYYIRTVSGFEGRCIVDDILGRPSQLVCPTCGEAGKIAIIHTDWQLDAQCSKGHIWKDSPGAYEAIALRTYRERQDAQGSQT